MEPTSELTLTHPSGCQVRFEMSAPSVAELVERTDKLISALVDGGYSVPVATAAAPSDGGPPLCPTHKKPMKPSQHGGWYCPIKITEDDGSGKPIYCKAKA